MINIPADHHGTIFDIIIGGVSSCDHTLLQYKTCPQYGTHKVLDYLGRYTHRVALSNDRILKVQNGEVTFTCRHRSFPLSLLQAGDHGHCGRTAQALPMGLS